MRFVRPIAIFLLVFLGLGSVVGAVPMIVDPDGARWRFLPMSLLQYSPFHSYLIPGIILLAANGLLAFWVVWRVLARKPQYGLWTAFQGCVLLGWLAVECYLLRVIMWAHYFYAAVALALIVCGLIMGRESGPKSIAQE